MRLNSPDRVRLSTVVDNVSRYTPLGNLFTAFGNVTFETLRCYGKQRHCFIGSIIRSWSKTATKLSCWVVRLRNKRLKEAWRENSFMWRAARIRAFPKLQKLTENNDQRGISRMARSNVFCVSYPVELVIACNGTYLPLLPHHQTKLLNRIHFLLLNWICIAP